MALDQDTLRVLYDAFREEFAATYGLDLGGSPAYDSGYRAGINHAIDVLVRLNDGYAPSPSLPNGGDPSG